MSSSITRYLQVDNSIPAYCQLDQVWCGPAAAQMILEGYPPYKGSAVDYPTSQCDLYKKIKSYNKDQYATWDTGPDGLRDTLQAIGPAHWIDVALSRADELMFAVLYAISVNKYPAGTLVYGRRHWMVVEGFDADNDPASTNSVMLQYLDVIDPFKNGCSAASSNSATGVRALISGAGWYSRFMYARVHTSLGMRVWENCFVAVSQKPAQSGSAKAAVQITGGPISSTTMAAEAACALLKQLPLSSRVVYDVLKNVKTCDAVLADWYDRRQYYLVILKDAGGSAIGSMMMEPSTGEFIGLSLLPLETQFLTAAEAIAVANTLPHTRHREEPIAEPTLLFRPSLEVLNPFLPAWKVRFATRTVYVAQDRQIFSEFHTDSFGN